MSVIEDMGLNEGLAYDAHCLLGPHEELLIDNETIPTTQSDSWSFCAVIELDPQVVDVKQDAGVLFGDDNFSFSIGCRNMLELARWGSLWWVKPCPVEVRTGQTCVVGFTADSQSLRLYVNGQLRDEHVVTVAERPTLSAISGPVYVGGSHSRRKSFKGKLDRLSFYTRVLSNTEMRQLSAAYLRPRLVSVQGMVGTFGSTPFTNCVKFAFTNGVEKTYGRKAEDGITQEEGLELDHDEYIVAVYGMKTAYSEYLSKGFTALTNKNRRLDVAGGARTDHHWTFRCAEGNEICGLIVADKAFEGIVVTGVQERPRLDEGSMECQRQIDQAYLSKLNEVKDQAFQVAKAKHISRNELPNISDWRFDAPQIWCNALTTAIRQPNRFLEDCIVDPGRPLHISDTAATLGATFKSQRVALKFMVDPDPVLAELLGRSGMDPCSVVPVIAVYAESGAAKDCLDAYPGSGGPLQYEGQDVLVQSLPQLTQRMQQAVKSKNRRYRYCLVMEPAEHTLHHSLAHEHIAGNDWQLLRKIALDITSAVHHLHTNGRVHADLRPISIVHSKNRWKLMNLEASCEKGTAIGYGRIPTSGYCPPEMARALLLAMDESGTVNSNKLGATRIEASVAYDLWSLGCVLSHMVFGCPLWKLDQNDQITSIRDLRELAGWDVYARNQTIYRLCAVNDSNDQKAAIDLIEQLLESTENTRLAYFKRGAEMIGVQEHFFFSGTSDRSKIDKVSSALQKEQAVLKQEQDRFEEVQKSKDLARSRISKQVVTLSHLMQGLGGSLPMLIFFVPSAAIRDSSEATASLSKLVTHPSRWFDQDMTIFFVDPVSLTIAPTNESQGFKLRLSKENLVAALPYLKLSLTLLKVSAVAGCLGGIPSPEISSWAGDYVTAQIEALAYFEGDAVTSGGTEETNRLFELIGEHCKSVLCNMSGDAQHVDPQLCQGLENALKESGAVLSGLLDAAYPRWVEQSGLSVITASDGCIEWVSPEYAGAFRQIGAKCLGTRCDIQKGTAETNVLSRFCLEVARCQSAEMRMARLATEKREARQVAEAQIAAAQETAREIQHSAKDEIENASKTSQEAVATCAALKEKLARVEADMNDVQKRTNEEVERAVAESHDAQKTAAQYREAATASEKARAEAEAMLEQLALRSEIKVRDAERNAKDQVEAAVAATRAAENEKASAVAEAQARVLAAESARVAADEALRDALSKTEARLHDIEAEAKERVERAEAAQRQAEYNMSVKVEESEALRLEVEKAHIAVEQINDSTQERVALSEAALLEARKEAKAEVANAVAALHEADKARFAAEAIMNEKLSRAEAEKLEIEKDARRGVATAAEKAQKARRMIEDEVARYQEMADTADQKRIAAEQELEQALAKSALAIEEVERVSHDRVAAAEAERDDARKSSEAAIAEVLERSKHNEAQALERAKIAEAKLEEAKLVACEAGALLAAAEKRAEESRKAAELASTEKMEAVRMSSQQIAMAQSALEHSKEKQFLVAEAALSNRKVLLEQVTEAKASIRETGSKLASAEHEIAALRKEVAKTKAERAMTERLAAERLTAMRREMETMGKTKNGWRQWRSKRASRKSEKFEEQSTTSTQGRTSLDPAEEFRSTLVHRLDEVSVLSSGIGRLGIEPDGEKEEEVKA